MATHCVTDYGAIGDGQANDARAIQSALDACGNAGGGRVVLPAGKTFLAGYLELRPHLEFCVERGARLMVSDRQEDLRAMGDVGPQPGRFQTTDRVFIGGHGLENVCITGGGVIDGRAKKFMVEEKPYIYRAIPERPHLIFLLGSRNLTIRDVTIVDAPVWAVRLSGCRDVVISGVRILNDLKVPNCDGIDPDHCRNVRISDCHIEAGDDCIVIKTRREYAEYGPSENITVTGCTLVSTSCALKIGTETMDDIRNVVFDACVIKSSNRGLGICLRDEGNVENVVFSNMTVETRLFYEGWWGKAEPIYVTAIPRNAETRVGRVRGVRFQNIVCRSENGAFLCGSPGRPVEDVALDNVTLELNQGSKWEGGVYDIRPCAGEGLIRRRTAGIFCERGRDIALRNCRVTWGANRPEAFGHALESHAVDGLRLEGFAGHAAHPERDQAVVADGRPVIAPDAA